MTRRIMHDTLSRMNAVIIGVRGMLGGDLLKVCRAMPSDDAVGVDLPEVDITDDAALSRTLPEADWIVNCAAYTRVDDAESDGEAAFAVNADGVRNVARVAAQRSTPVLHISTDYVFDGAAREPYDEGAAVHPLSVYGQSKLAGEQALIEEGGAHMIVRTQSLFGVGGPHFVRAISRKVAQSNDPLNVVDDQVSAPTYTRHLAVALVRLMHCRAGGVVHLSASGACSWYDFARAIVERIKPGHEVRPIASAELQRPAARPAYAVLSHRRYEALTGQRMPSWDQGLDEYLNEEESLL